MTTPSSVSALTSALVHQSALSQPIVFQRHATFIAKRLAVTFGVFAIAPFFVAFRGAPTGPETLVFACSFAPLAAAVVAARTGRLALAHSVAFLGLVALSLSLWLGLGCGPDCAIAWLITAQLEAMLAGETRLSLWAGMVTGATLLGIFATTLHGGPVPLAPPAITEAFSGLALAYAIVVAAGSWTLIGSTAYPRRPTQAQASVTMGTNLQDEAAVENIATLKDMATKDMATKDVATKDMATWHAAFAMLDELVVGLDKSGSVISVPNHRGSSLGIPIAALMGRGLFEHVHVSDRPAFLQLIADAAHGNETGPTTIRLQTSDGAAAASRRYRGIEMRTRRVVSPNGMEVARPVTVAAVLRDTDAARAPGDRVMNAGHAIEDATCAQDHFLANMSHELRTPLNAIIGFSEMLSSRTMRPAEADKQREYARIIHESGRHLLSVVNAILDMSRIRSDAFTLVPEPFEFGSLMDLCCDMVALTAGQGRVRIVRDQPVQIAEIFGDKRAYQQILINLLSNAVKFTPEHGQVTVSAKPDNESLVISVIDTGIGIGAADLGRIGAPFFQVRAATSRPLEGTGLGLSVVRGLVGLHGGTIAFESELGRGTRVTVCLPLDGRKVRQKSAFATIETIVRHSVPEPAFIDQRMRKIA